MLGSGVGAKEGRKDNVFCWVHVNRLLLPSSNPPSPRILLLLCPSLSLTLFLAVSDLVRVRNNWKQTQANINTLFPSLIAFFFLSLCIYRQQIHLRLLIFLPYCHHPDFILKLSYMVRLLAGEFYKLSTCKFDGIFKTRVSSQSWPYSPKVDSLLNGKLSNTEQQTNTIQLA